ncbi:hypothetical protein BOSE21B_110031 [Bosea sp. 21B]|nr:hypothetical protein BOSE21B_110031 [Bosea sp. 21B]CAD5284062.1 hypothetical protein BOSE7B_41186 [Bosea sp. 7B]
MSLDYCGKAQILRHFLLSCSMTMLS